MAALWRCACGRSLVSRALPSTKYFLSPGNSVQNVKRFSVFAEGPRTSVTAVALQVVLHRNFADRGRESGDYDKLWSAATGGRGTGRGRKKKRPQSVDKEMLKFGRAGMTWEGLNAPVQMTKDMDRDGDQDQGRDQGRERWDKQRNEGPKPGQRSFQRGWSGTTWPGRKIGPPETPDGEVLDNFESIVLELRRVSNMTSGGRKRTQRALVAVGNGNGAAGFAVGKGQTPFSAIRKAKNRAVNYLHHIERCDNHTVFHDFETKFKKTRIEFERRPPGYGLRCHRAIKAVAELAGIQDMRCKVIGPTTALSLVQAVFQGLLSQETHQQLADRTGRHVVELRQECGMRPIVVASPSDKAWKTMIRKEADQNKDYNFEEIFDPHRGLHRPRKRSSLY